MTDQMPQPTGLSNPSVGDDDFFNQDFSKFGQPQKNLEVSGGDLGVGLAGSAARGVGTGIAEIGLSDLLRAGVAISDKLPGSQIADVVSRKINGWTEDEQAAKKADVINKIASVTTDPIDNIIVKPVVNPIGTAIKKGGEALIENGTSDDYKEALRGRELFTGGGVSDFAISDSAGDPAVWAAKLTDGIGSLGGTLAVGALTGGTVKSIVKRQMLKRGASMELADETARLAGIKWGQRGAMAQGVNMSTGQSADQARSQVEALSWDQLLTSKTFTDQVKEISRDPQFEGASGTDLLNEARRRTADYAASIAKSDPKTWAAAAAGTLLGDAALFKMLQGTGAKGIAAGALQGMAGEGVGEAIEEGTQQYIGNEATNEAGGQKIDPMEGVLQAAATAGTIGALTGGAVGAVGGARGAMAPQEDASTNEVTAPDSDASNVPPSAIPAFDVAISEVQGIEQKYPGQHAIGRDGDKYRAAYVDEMGNVQVTPAYGKVEDVRTAMGFKAPAQPAESAGPVSEARLSTGGPAVDEFAEIPAYQRQDGGRVKGFAEDSEVQRALAGDFGPSVAELVKRQVDAGEQGPTAQEKPFVDALNAPLALPNKDIIFAGDANAKQPSTEVAEPGAFDDKPVGPGPQFRGSERARWQDGQEGEVLPPDAGGNPAGALPGRVIEGEAREVGAELPYKPFIAGQDNRAAVSEEQRRQVEQSAMAEQQQNQPKQIGQSDTIFAPGEPGADNKNSAYTPPRLSRDQVDNSLGEQSTRDPRSPVAQAIEQAGSEQDSIFGKLKTLRITKRGKPFASQKEAQLASRPTETPIELPTGGFGVVAKAELEQVQASQAPVKQLSSNAGQLEQAVSQEGTDGMPQQLPEEIPVLPQARQDSLPPTDGVAPEPNTAPATDAGVAISGAGKQRITIESLTDKSIIVKGDKNDAELKDRVEAAWPKAKPLYNERHKGWVFSSKRDGVVREALSDLLNSDVSDQATPQMEKVQPKESPVVAQSKPATTGKLRDTGKTLINLGREKANQPRLSNTPKRASQAASAIRDAESMQADGETLIKIADAVDNGEAPHLSRLSNKVQYQTLDQIHRRAIPAKHMEGGEYRGYYEGRTEQRRKSGVTVDDYADQIQYPTITVHPDHLRSASKALGDIRGYKGLADKLNYAARLVTNSDRYQPAVLNEETANALIKAAKATGNRDVKWAAEHVGTGMTTIDRLRRMGIDNRDQLVAAIKELDAIQVPRKQESRLQQLERGLVGNKIPGYFNTQGEALNRVMRAADVKPGDEVLEPSAGKGNIADAAKQAGAKVDTVERHNTLREILTEKGHNLVGNDFIQLDESMQYDKVIMNPPFEQQQDIDHVRKAWNHVKPGGRLVAVMSAGVESNSNRKATEFRQWLDENSGTMERLPEGSFKDSDRSTGVNTVMVVMDKPGGNPTKSKLHKETEVALFSLSDAAPNTRGMTKPELEMVATDWSKQYKGAASARIMVAANQAEMNEVLGMVGAAMPDGQTINAAYLPGYKTLLLNAEAIQSPKRARELMRHELLAHHGLREVVGDDAYISIIEAVKRGKDIKGIKDAYYQVAENYTDMHPDVQAEEVFAHWMETQPDRGELAIWWRGIVRRVKDALRAVGLVGERSTEEEFNRVLDAIATGMRNGSKPSRRVMESWLDAPAYSMKRDPFKPDTFDARAFADEVDAVYRSGTSPRHQLRIGDTPSIYVRLGAKNHELVMPASVVKKATNPADRSHNVAIDDIRRLPQLISDPLAVMKSATENNALVSLVEALDMNNKPVIVAIHLDAKGDGFSEINKVASVYGKDEVAALQRLLDNNLVYLNKEKAAWFHAAGLQLPGANYHGGLNKSVLTKDDIRNSGALFSLGANLADQSIIGKAESLAKAAPSSVLNWIKEQRGVGLGALTDLQIDQIYRGVTGGAVSRYQKLRTKMEADRNDILLDAETRIDPLWDSLGKEQKKALSNLMHDATMAKLHPDLSLADNSLYQEAKERLDKAVKPETKARYQDELNTIADNHKHLAERYNLGLNKEGKALYQTMRETYDKQWADLRDAIEQRLEDMMGAEGKTLAAELRLQMEHALKHGPYFPLARFGDYVVKASKGDEHIREHFERRKDAEQAIKQYQRDGYNAVMTVKEEGNGGQANSNALGMKVMQLLDKAGESGASASAIKDDVWQAMLQMLPDASFAKHAIHRRRVKGASRDGHRAYLNSVYHYAHHVSKIRYGHKMQAELNKMNEQIQAGVSGEESNIKPGDLEVAQQVLNEMNKRHELNMNPKGAKWTGWAGNLGFMWYMAGSPASAIINMTQNFTVMLPQLGAKYGFVKASAAMAKAMHDYAKHGKFKAGTKEAWVSLTRADSGITSDEKALLNSLYKAGALDLTQAHSVAARADTDLQDAKPGAAWKRKTMAWLGSMFHNAEVLNREVAALAAYRLLKSADPSLSPEQYADKVTEMVYDGHGNYAASNRPRYMRGDVTKVLTQFKIYSQMMTFTLYRNAYLAAKGDKVALKTLGGVLGTHFIMAGMMGLPYPVTAALYAIAAAADDDDDRTGEASFRLGLAETLGTGLGELVARGPMDAMTGLSIAGRTGINDLWFREPKEGAEGDDLAWHVTQQIAGPVLGIGVQAARGLSMMSDGDYQRGAETMMPKAVKDLMKTYRQSSEGERTRKGDVIIDDVSAFNLAMQAMGFSNAEMAKVYDAREYIKGKEGRIEDERSKLMSDYFMARKDGDEEAMAEVMVRIREFNSSHYRTEAITSRTLRQSIKSKQRSAHRTQGGVYLSRNREYLRAEGGFIGDGGTATN